MEMCQGTYQKLGCDSLHSFATESDGTSGTEAQIACRGLGYVFGAGGLYLAKAVNKNIGL